MAPRLDDRGPTGSEQSNSWAPMKPETVTQPVQAADVLVADAVPLRVAAQQRRADQHADRDDHAERLDRNSDRSSRPEVEVRNRGRASEGRSRA